jgi:hypothetical protein
MVMIKQSLYFAAFIALIGSSSVMAQIPGSVSIPSEEELSDTIDFDGTDPCPEPRQALGNTPNDLKKIQEDITRFNLCLQRAQLLNRLNQLAAENLETINSTLDEKLMGVVGNVEMPELPPMPVEAPPLPVNANNGGAPSGQQTAQQLVPAPMAVSPTWSVREVTGRGGDLTAVLVDGMDNLVRVKRGDKLPETETIVQRVTPTNVSVLKDGEVNQLSWTN